MLIAKRRIKVT